MNAVYIRVSTTDQNLESQRAEVQVYLDRAGLKAKWFEDQETGTTLKRPGFTRLQQAISAGKVDTVIVWKLDRISRTFRDGVQVIGNWLSAGVRLVSVTQRFDLAGIQGQLIASVLFAVAEMERDTLRERQRAGIAIKKAAGGYTGRQKGTTKSKPQRAQELRRSGLKRAEIAQALGISLSTVDRYLKSSTTARESAAEPG